MLIILCLPFKVQTRHQALPASFFIDGFELFQGDILMTEDIREELRAMGLYPSKNDSSRDSSESPSRAKRASMSNKAKRWMGSDNRPEIPFLLEPSIRK